jgi:peptidoglycan/LPS O-acetylase OafA/YrhL
LGIWATARDLAGKTPAERNRYVDFLRAVSILVVVIGHWLIATFSYVDGQLMPGHLLKSHPQYQWLTWVFQVMPIFFIVGGYSNAVSLESAKRKGIDYAGWLVTRLHRLVTPLLLLIVAWAITAVVLRSLGVRPEIVVFLTQASFVPTWFLAIYIMLVILAPPAYYLWRRFGFASFAGFAVLAVFVDVAFFAFDQRWLGWSNYFWVWLAVHQLGFAWRDGHFKSAPKMLAMAAFGFVTLYLMIDRGPYPMAMVGSPDEGLSNTLPPKATLLALALFQCGLLLALERPLRRALEGARLWAATVLVNSMIMTVYLWHITVQMAVGAAFYLSGDFAFRLEPASMAWWLSRPLWIGMLILVLVPVALVLSAVERRARAADARTPSAARQITGAIMACLGISFLSLWGLGGGPATWVDEASVALVVVGAFLSGLIFSEKSR